MLGWWVVKNLQCLYCKYCRCRWVGGHKFVKNCKKKSLKEDSLSGNSLNIVAPNLYRNEKTAKNFKENDDKRSKYYIYKKKVDRSTN